MKQKRIRTFFVGVVVVTLFAFCASSARAQSAGETLFKTKCAACHGADGKGDTPVGKKMGAHDFASPEVQKQSDSELTQIVSKGKNKMPGFEAKLKPEDIKALVAYVRQLGKGK